MLLKIKQEWIILLPVLYLSSAGCAQLSPLSPKRRPNLFLVPNDYVGWLHVEYGVKGAPALPIQKGFRVYRFPRKGTIRTSSPLLVGWATDRTYYTTSKGWKELYASESQGNGMVWGSNFAMGGVAVGDGKGNMRRIPTPSTEDVFIGTWKQFYHRKTRPPRSKEEESALKATY